MAEVKNSDTLRGLEAHTEYYPNGQLHRTFSYLNNLLHGPVEIYLPLRDGKTRLAYREHYNEGQKDGVQETYHNTNDGKTVTIKRQHYLKGAQHGVHEIYHRNGQLLTKSFYNNNQREGVWERYDDASNLLEHKEYLNGQLHGSCISYYNDHKAERKTDLTRTYCNGKLNGTVTKWLLNGNRLWEHYHVNGKQHGAQRLFLPRKDTDKLTVSDPIDYFLYGIAVSPEGFRQHLIRVAKIVDSQLDCNDGVALIIATYAEY